MISCIIIDDERQSRETLKKIIERYFADKVVVLYLAESVKEGVYAIKKYHPDVVFLDIEMPEENGFQLFGYFEQYDFEVIFTTAYKQYAIDAIKHAALDYLLKPINYIDLSEVLSRFEKKKKSINNQVRIETLLENFNNEPDNYRKIALPTLDGFRLERVNNIMYCYADENYTIIVNSRNEKILVAKTMKYIEELLPVEIFFRIHKSYIVNMNFIKSYSKSEGYRITLENGTELDVATRRNDAFIKALTRANS